MRPADTTPEAWEVQIRIWRCMTPGERLALAMGMSDQARALTESGIRRRHPAWTARQVRTEMLRQCGALPGDVR